MPSWLHCNGSEPATFEDLAVLVEQISGWGESASMHLSATLERTDEQLARTLRGWWSLPATKEIPNPATASLSRPWIPAETLLENPALACGAVRRTAGLLRMVHEILQERGLPTSRIRSVRVVRKPSRGPERVNVERTVENLVRYMGEHGMLPNGWANAPRVELARFLSCVRMHDPPRAALRGHETSAEVALYRALSCLIDAIDDDVKRGFRALAQAMADISAAIHALTMRLLHENPEVGEPMTRLEGAQYADVLGGDDTASVGLALAINELRWVSTFSGELHREIRGTCLFAPHDLGDRGTHSVHVLFAKVVKHLDDGGLSVRDIAQIVDDGMGCDLKQRMKRVRQCLNARGTEGRLRDLRWVAFPGFPLQPVCPP
jgi:hypothetical protein